VVSSLFTGMRSEEVRAVQWDHVDLDGDPPTVAIWKSVRQHGDVKTQKSRRTLALPEPAIDALRKRRAQQNEDRLKAGPVWQNNGLVFTTTIGTPLSHHNVRRDFRKICVAAGIGASWSPRELRHSFVSLMSQNGVPVEEIARLAGHTSTRTTELVYRKELRPVITTGADVMDRIFA
jgi:integrase